jgi:hypothetical protein
VNHRIAAITVPKKERALNKNPEIESAVSGAEVCDKIALVAHLITFVIGIDTNFELPANLSCRSISITAVLNPVQAIKPRRKRFLSCIWRVAK